MEKWFCKSKKEIGEREGGKDSSDLALHATI